MTSRLLKICMGTLLVLASVAVVSAQQNSSTPAGQSPQANQQKARAFLDQMIQTLGGQAYLNIEDAEFEGRYGRFYHERSEASAPYHRFWQWPDKDRMEFTKQRDIVQLFIGDQIYEITFRGTRIIDAKKDYDFQMQLERRHHTLEIVLRQWLNDPGTALFDEGPSLSENHSVERITVINSKNDSVTIFIDTDTHLPVKKSFVMRDPQGYRDEIAEVYDNWKMIQGVNTPYNTLISRNGELQRQYFVTAASYNNHPKSSLFEPTTQYIPTKK